MNGATRVALSILAVYFLTGAIWVGRAGGVVERFFVAADAGCTTDNTDTADCWSSSSGGAGGASIPVSGENATIDANSCTTSCTITIGTALVVNDFTITAAADDGGEVTIGITNQSITVENDALLDSGTITASSGSKLTVGGDLLASNFDLSGVPSLDIDMTGTGRFEYDCTNGSSNRPNIDQFTVAASGETTTLRPQGTCTAGTSDFQLSDEIVMGGGTYTQDKTDATMSGGDHVVTEITNNQALRLFSVGSTGTMNINRFEVERSTASTVTLPATANIAFGADAAILDLTGNNSSAQTFGVGPTWLLSGDFIAPNLHIILEKASTFDSADHDITLADMSCAGGGNGYVTCDLGASTVTISGQFSCGSSSAKAALCTLDAGGSITAGTIKLGNHKGDTGSGGGVQGAAGTSMTATGSPDCAGGTQWYVNASTGSDANGGLSAGDAWQTITKVISETGTAQEPGSGECVRFAVDNNYPIATDDILAGGQGEWTSEGTGAAPIFTLTAGDLWEIETFNGSGGIILHGIVLQW